MTEKDHLDELLNAARERPELLNCVFCSSEVVVVGRISEPPYYYQACCKCGARGPEKDTIDGAFSAWNNRVSLQ